jgi:predicted ArsR family transcriptional regulator
MPRLSESQKHSIVALREASLSWNQIAKQLKILRSTVRAVFAKNLLHGDVANRKVSGRPTKVSPSGERFISRIAKKYPQASVSQITMTYNSGRTLHDNISSMTMRRKLYKCGFHKRYVK